MICHKASYGRRRGERWPAKLILAGVKFRTVGCVWNSRWKWRSSWESDRKLLEFCFGSGGLIGGNFFELGLGRSVRGRDWGFFGSRKPDARFYFSYRVGFSNGLTGFTQKPNLNSFGLYREISVDKFHTAIGRYIATWLIYGSMLAKNGIC